MHIPTLHFPAPHLATSLPLPEGRAGTASEPSAQQTPLTPLPRYKIIAMPHTAPSPPAFSCLYILVI